MGPKIVRVYGDENGDTHLQDVPIHLNAHRAPVGTTNLIPFATTTQMLWVEYPHGQGETMPGLHEAPQRQFVICVEGAFEVTTSTGEKQLFEPGDWFLADDVDSLGHITVGVRGERRVNLVVPLDDGWELPVEE